MQEAAELAVLTVNSVPVSLRAPGVGCWIQELFLEQHTSKSATGVLSSMDHVAQEIGMPAMKRSHALHTSDERRTGDRRPAWLAANKLSFVSEEAMNAFSEIMFAWGELNDQHREALLERYLIWEKLVDSDAVEIKRLFRLLVDEKIAEWAAEANR